MKIQQVITAILSFLIASAHADGQLHLGGSLNFNALNNAPATMVVNQAVTNAQQGTYGSSGTVIHNSGINVIDNFPDGFLVVADQAMAVTYGIPFRANQDADVLKNTLEAKISAEQSTRTAMMNLYNSMNDADRRSMDANGFWDLIAGYDARINRYMQALDAIYYNRSSLNFEANKPPVINAESRFIDPITTVKLMRAEAVEYGPGGHLVPKDGIPFDVLNALPNSSTLTIYRR